MALFRSKRDYPCLKTKKKKFKKTLKNGRIQLNNKKSKSEYYKVLEPQSSNTMAFRR